MEDELMKVLEANNSKDNVLIAHNLDFDVDMIGRHGFASKMQHIDTLRCARHLLKDAEGHSLGVLFYQYGLYKKIDKEAKDMGIDISKLSAHDAMYDVLMLILLTKLLASVAKGGMKELIRLTTQPVIIEKFTFGKYKGELIEEVAAKDAPYLDWMLNKMDNLGEDMRHTLLTRLGRLT
jgi:DNA polymerase-3 subunit epsilon/exodeoxyribonuclease X